MAEEPAVATSGRPAEDGSYAVTVRTGDLDYFRSPADDIGCEIRTDGATCSVRDATWTDLPPRPADCEDWMDYGHGAFFDSERSGVLCSSDTPYNPEAPVLKHGEGWMLGSVTCVSSPAGVTCSDVKTGNGFSVSRDGYTLG